MENRRVFFVAQLKYIETQTRKTCFESPFFRFDGFLNHQQGIAYIAKTELPNMGHIWKEFLQQRRPTFIFFAIPIPWIFARVFMLNDQRSGQILL